ncbi:unnamed protein product [Darwinula stevensoni]|uniref:Transmembrane protein 161B n=1 Tax=Darwinula stevensoni TaxID=69355 RepID=A0A7R8XG51_9CRUS|nr:unnamed protein product [Darwinula stevensoni]CAG0891341.1 unnamed protein product [Darwinula stevensoni]
MALFGFQLVTTMIMASILQKIMPQYSFAKWLLCNTGLIRYLHPTDEELLSLVRVPKAKGKGHQKNGTSDTFMVPRSIDIQLDAVKVQPYDVVHLRFYMDYQWLVDFGLFTLLVYLITEIYTSWQVSTHEMNLSLVWCFLVIGFSLKVLFSLTALYFRGEEAMGERSLCIVAASTYLVVAMAVLIVDESSLELGVEDAYSAFSANASSFLAHHASKLFLKFILALIGAALGGFLTFPGLRLARMHWDALRFTTERRLLQLLLHISFISPFGVVIAWVRPLSRDYFTTRIWPGLDEPLLSKDGFESLRLWLILGVGVVRLLLLPFYLQAYLNLAHERMELQKKEAGKISNRDLQRSVARVFYYLCVVTLQYLAPLFLLIYQGLLLKSAGGYSWWSRNECPADFEPSPEKLEPTLSSEMTVTLSSLRQVFSEEVARGVLTFTTWWTAFSWFSSSALGIFYYSYFSKT